MAEAGYLPWHEPTWRALVRQYRGERQPHALLLAGPPGLGKRLLATRFAAWLLCQEHDTADDACGRCRSCLLFLAGNHPDIHHCGLEEDKQSIAVDTVRELSIALQLSSQYGGWKIAIIEPADRMNAHSCNALLKTLEEPAGHSLLMLVTARPARLPPTVRSRCQRVAMTAPRGNEPVEWLKSRGARDPVRALALAAGAPLAALALDESGFITRRAGLLGTLAELLNGRLDAASAAAHWQDLPLDAATGWLWTVILDLLRLRRDGGARARLTNDDLREGLQSLAQRLDLPAMFHYLDELTRVRGIADSSVNPRLQLEGLLVPWGDGLDMAA